MSRGSWIWGTSGSIKIKACAEVYLQTCEDRLENKELTKLGYQSWMSSIYLSRMMPFRDASSQIKCLQPLNVLDFRREYLDEIDVLFEAASLADPMTLVGDVRTSSEKELSQLRAELIFSSGLKLVDH